MPNRMPINARFMIINTPVAAAINNVDSIILYCERTIPPRCPVFYKPSVLQYLPYVRISCYVEKRQPEVFSVEPCMFVLYKNFIYNMVEPFITSCRPCFFCVWSTLEWYKIIFNIVLLTTQQHTKHPKKQTR